MGDSSTYWTHGEKVTITIAQSFVCNLTVYRQLKVLKNTHAKVNKTYTLVISNNVSNNCLWVCYM
jgi:hypothetical protein